MFRLVVCVLPFVETPNRSKKTSVDLSGINLVFGVHVLERPARTNLRNN